MTLPFPIAESQTDAKSPVDDNLMDSIRLDLDYLDAIITGGSALLTWNVNGRLRPLGSYKKAVDTIGLVTAFTPGVCRASLKKSGTSGSLTFDIRKITTPKTPITEIAYQYNAATQSISNVAPALATQSIARSTSQISTQSVSLVKAAINITSIIQVIGTNKWRLNLATAPDADWGVGDSITVAGATAGGNNTTLPIAEINQSGFPSVVVVNASGVAQTGAVGTVQLNLWSYNFTNPVSTEFAAGDAFTAASHTAGGNNGAITIYRVNQSGNNIWVKNSAGVAQAGVAGTADVLRWKYTFSGAASTTDFIVGENAKMASHTTGANNGNFAITAVNLSGNNVTVYNTAGVAQGGAVGTVNTNRWTYVLPTDPSAQITAADRVRFVGHTNLFNDGTFVVKEVNRSASTSVTVYNEFGITQVGTTGNTFTTRKLVKFTADQSLVYSTDSYIDIVGCPNGNYNYSQGRDAFRVLQVNRGGGSNFNVVIDVEFGTAQPNPAGYVQVEMRSIFLTTPSMSSDFTSLEANQIQTASFTNFVGGSLLSATPLGLFVLGVPGGDPTDLTVFIQ